MPITFSNCQTRDEKIVVEAFTTYLHYMIMRRKTDE